jgi:cardiolipin synthase
VIHEKRRIIPEVGSAAGRPSREAQGFSRSRRSYGEFANRFIRPLRKSWVRARLFLLLAISPLTSCSIQSEKTEIRVPVAAKYSVRDPQFRRAADALLGNNLTPGNRIEVLLNGDRIFPSMLKAIGRAQRTVNFETYVYWSGQIGHQFALALAERARAGVRVRTILDWQGTAKMSLSDAGLMREAGVEIVTYRPLRPWDLKRFNNRTHRKLLIVDGKVGFIGGVGIADLWRGDARTPEEWRDTHYRLEGPVVAQLQGAFMDNWVKAKGEVLHGDEFFPPLAHAGSAWAQAVKSSPGEGNQSMRLTFLLAIASAQRSIKVETPYFVPDRLMVSELLSAVKRGVEVEVIVPGPETDSPVTRATSRSGWGSLLEAGVKMYEFQPTMLHAKLLIVDGAWASVGSANFDQRSMRLNDEANLNVLDRGFAQGQAAIFERDKARARRVDLAKWTRRPIMEKLTTPIWEAVRPEL